MQLDNKKCAAFLALIETGSFDEASNKLFITQSAISQRIQSLEETLGKVLVVRERPCRATKQGMALYEHLQKVKIMEQNFLDHVESGSNQYKTLSIAASIGAFESFLFPVLAEKCISESITIDIKIDTLSNTFQMLKRGAVQACITSEHTKLNGCSTISLGNLIYCLVASESFIHKWFKNGINREILRFAPAILFNDNEKIHFEYIEDNFGLTKSTYPYHTIPSSDSYIEALSKGLGYGLMPKCKINQKIEDLKIRKITSFSEITIPLYWHHLSDITFNTLSLNNVLISYANSVLSQKELSNV